MSYQEKKSLVSLAGTVLIFGFYCLYMFQRHSGTDWASTDAFRFWGSFVLILIPVSIVAKIILQIVFSIVFNISSDEKEPTFTDEYDKLIGLKASRNSYYAFSAGFLLAMGSLVLEMPYSAMFIILILSGFTAEVVGYLSQLYLYRKGV